MPTIFQRSRGSLRLPLCTALAVAGLAGCASLAPTGTGRGPLAGRIEPLFPDSLFPPSGAGVSVLSVTTGEILYQRDPDLLFTPASNQKLMTSAAALILLGPRHELATEALIDTGARPAIIVRGNGDALFSTDDLDTLASALTAALPPRPAWLLKGDVSAFDDSPFGRGWMWDDEPDPGAASVSPLCLDGNTVKAVITPGSSPGDTASVRTSAPSGFLSILNATTTVADTVRSSLAVRRAAPDDSNRFVIEGEIRAGDPPMSRRIAVRHPERLFLIRLAERLRGVRIEETGADTASSGGVPVARRAHTLDTLIAVMNRRSDNLVSECVFRNLGRTDRAERGSGEGASLRVREALAGLGVDTARVVVADGSGASRYNLVSARALTTLLAALARDTALYPVFRESLPIAGRTGTLAGRMRGTAAEGNVRAKTGTMAGVSSLSGYATTADGELLAFSILVGNFPRSPAPYRAVQDSLCALLAGLRR